MSAGQHCVNQTSDQTLWMDHLYFIGNTVPMAGKFSWTKSSSTIDVNRIAAASFQRNITVPDMAYFSPQHTLSPAAWSRYPEIKKSTTQTTHFENIARSIDEQSVSSTATEVNSNQPVNRQAETHVTFAPSSLKVLSSTKSASGKSRSETYRNAMLSMKDIDLSLREMATMAMLQQPADIDLDQAHKLLDVAKEEHSTCMASIHRAREKESEARVMKQVRRDDQLDARATNIGQRVTSYILKTGGHIKVKVEDQCNKMTKMRRQRQLRDNLEAIQHHVSTLVLVQRGYIKTHPCN